VALQRQVRARAVQVQRDQGSEKRVRQAAPVIGMGSFRRGSELVESKAMRIVNNVTVLDLIWSGPYQLADLVAFKGAEDYGVYQIYGTHGVNGPDSLLYIGMALL
jgi:hypothetical protein